MPFDALLNSAQGKTALTGVLSGAAGGALISALTGNKSAKTLLKTGGLIAVGGIAMKAWQAYSNKGTDTSVAEAAVAPVPTPAPTIVSQPEIPVLSPSQATANAHPTADGLLLVLRSMISAAHADGHLSEQEQQKVWNKSVELGLPASELAVISEALHQPLHPAQIAVLATTLEAKIEVFTAAAIVIDDTCSAGQNYLDDLGKQLDLPVGLIGALKLQASAAA
ncbi:MAG: uncharacterized membrane protein YebE (DUF533 family) [Candidatus Azotimanducaceae bacterium]|jgi:uncharacterized membrane protein YebE (DUF533 family)